MKRVTTRQEQIKVTVRILAMLDFSMGPQPLKPLLIIIFFAE
jgi:hypothetical protein